MSHHFLTYTLTSFHTSNTNTENVKPKHITCTKQNLSKKLKRLRNVSRLT